LATTSIDRKNVVKKSRHDVARRLRDSCIQQPRLAYVATERAALMPVFEPDTEIWPAGTKRGFQPGTTSALGDADFALVALTG
jgi:hypothetical protein